MSALRVEVETASSEFTGFVPPVVLDCWKAELVVALERGGSWLLNGVPLPLPITSPTAGNAQRLPVVLKFGGMIDAGGVPVGLNSIIYITDPLASGNLVSYIVTKTYFDPSTDDPQRIAP